MSRLPGFLLSASAVLLFSAPARAVEGAPPALNKPAQASAAAAAQPAIAAELKAPATSQAAAVIPGYTDFDAFTSVNDPLYREGARESLRQAVTKEAEKKSVPAVTLRDAPISKGVRPGAVRPVKAGGSLRKPGPARPVHADPVKSRNTI
ncbi:MAG: hypothetical protein HY550_04385 [Elusimicrobia bacterium]|nr:hypothetical protein [Elusimicrobiota bacterium]